VTAVRPGKRYLDWELPDPVGPSQVRPIREEIGARVRELISKLDT
jgi:arsenate reductase (thioredoxin)